MRGELTGNGLLQALTDLEDGLFPYRDERDADRSYLRMLDTDPALLAELLTQLARTLPA